MPVGVVALAFVGVRENAVSLRRFLELLLGLGVARIAIGVQLQGELKARLVDMEKAATLIGQAMLRP